MPWGYAAAAVGSAVVGSMLTDTSAADASAAASRQQSEIASDQWNEYKKNIQPLEVANAQRAAEFSSIANKNKAAAQAGADVTAQFAGLRDKLNKSPGFNPNSEAYLRTMADLGLSEAAQKATAETGARDKVQALGDAKVTDAISLGKGLAANAQTGLASAAAQQAAAARQSNTEAQQVGQAVGGIFASKGFRDWASGGTKSGGASAATTGDLQTDQLIGLAP